MCSESTVFISQPVWRYPTRAIMRCIALLGLSLACLVGCATYRDDLARGQHYYDLSQYDHALSVWRMLERDWDSLDDAEQSRYAYLRGMTDYRMGYRADARHWLALSRAIIEKHPGGLDAQSIAQLDQALTQLNDAVYRAGPPPNPTAAGRELTNEPPAPSASSTPTTAAILPPVPSASARPAPRSADSAAQGSAAPSVNGSLH
jgi:hypothetical protein